MRDATRIVRSTLTEAVAGEPLHRGPVFAAPFHAPGDAAGVAYTYARSANPTWTALERAIAGIEGAGAEVLLFGSGMAAVAAVFGALLRPGDVVVMAPDAYFAARAAVAEYFGAMGVELRLAAMGGPMAELEGAKLLWLETPSNPRLEICDVRAMSEAAHRAGALVAVDNSTATPLGQPVLALGADVAVVSDSKAMSGHSDLLLGHVAVRDPALYERLERWRTLTGGVAGTMEAWLALRSLATLPLRLERSSANAMRVAEFLSGRSEVVGGVMYPGLKSHPGHGVAAAQMRMFGPVLSFVLPDKRAAEVFLQRAELVTEATSFGGVTTTAERRARWGHDAVPEGFIRMSVGCEDVEDLLEDMGRALEMAE